MNSSSEAGLQRTKGPRGPRGGALVWGLRFSGAAVLVVAALKVYSLSTPEVRELGSPLDPVLPFVSRRLLAWFSTSVEVLLGTALIALNRVSIPAALATSALGSVFVAYHIVIGLGPDASTSCGCFGNMVAPRFERAISLTLAGTMVILGYWALLTAPIRMSRRASS